MRQVKQVFSIPNSFIGRLWLWYFKRHLNADSYRLRVRGRTARKGKSTQSIPLGNAKRLGLYLDWKGGET